jgi:hypothetical protein
MERMTEHEAFPSVLTLAFRAAPSGCNIVETLFVHPGFLEITCTGITELVPFCISYIYSIHCTI